MKVSDHTRYAMRWTTVGWVLAGFNIGRSLQLLWRHHDVDLVSLAVAATVIWVLKRPEAQQRQ